MLETHSSQGEIEPHRTHSRPPPTSLHSGEPGGHRVEYNSGSKDGRDSGSGASNPGGLGEAGREGGSSSGGHPHHTTPSNLTGHSVRCQSSLGVSHSTHKFTPVQRGRLDAMAGGMRHATAAFSRKALQDTNSHVVSVSQSVRSRSLDL